MGTTFNITAPDGTQYQVQGPDGATEQQALAQVQAQHQAAPAAQPDNGGILKNLGAGVVGAVTGAAKQAVDIFNPVSDMAHVASWATGRKDIAAAADKMDLGTVVAHTLNSAVPNAINPEKVTQSTFPEKLARGAGAGLTGALIPGGEGYTVGSILRNAALGATSGAGAVTGAEVAPEPLKPLAALAGGILAPMGAVGTINGIRAGLTAAKGAGTAFTSAGPEQTVGKILAQAAGGSVPETAEAPLPGMQPTFGQASGNPGILNLERSVEQTPSGVAPAAANRAASNSAVMDAVEKLGDTSSPASAKMLSALDAARETARQNTRTAWKQAGIDETAPLAIAPLKQDIGDYIGGLTRSGKAAIPANITDVFNDFGDTEPLREIQDWRSGLAKSLRDARMSGDDNGMRILGGIADKVDDFLDNGPTNRPDNHIAGTPADDALTEEQKARYDIARASTRGDKQIFRAPGSPIVTALSPKDFGQSAESNTANLFIKPSTSPGASESFDAYMSALKRGYNTEAGYQAARDAFAQKFKDAITGVPDAQGNPTIKPAAVSKFVDNYDHIINSDLFNKDQRDLLDRINRAANMTASTSRAGAKGGSDTFAKLNSNSWVDAMIGVGAKKVARTVGAAAGYATGGPFGAAAGAYGAPKIMETMLSANKAAATNLLTKALYDPELAKTLMLPATKASAAKISLPLQARILSALAGSRANDNSARKVNP